MINPQLNIPREALTEFCKKNPIRELAIFGSATRSDFEPERSDIDLLVELDDSAKIGMLRFFAMQEELESIFNRKVDLVSKRGLKPAIRDHVLLAREVLYAK